MNYDRDPNYSKCEAYKGYCRLHNVCVAEGQLDADAAAILNYPHEFFVKYRREAKAYIERCARLGCVKTQELRERKLPGD